MTIASDNVYDRVNDYGAVRISLAGPNDIRSWSFGEVKKPETINYRTYRPERDGLFCERIFGPERDYECACGKYKGTKYKGIICDRCGVKVTHSRVRRKRMGHINLAAPVVHIWFFKAMPSRLGTLLEMKTSDLEKIVYFQDYVVVDPGSTDLEFKQVLTEEEKNAAVDKHGPAAFTAMMGAEAVRELLSPLKLDLHELSDELRQKLGETKSKQKQKDYSKRLKLVEQIRGSSNDPQWMVLDVVPVIPPDLRPLVMLESGNFATSDLNDLYRRIINRNNRLKKLMDLNAPEVIVRNEKRMLQQAVDALFDNGRCRRPVLGSSNRPLKSITDMIKGKQGRFRENLLGKRVDYSARSVIVVGPELKLHQCGLPKKIALELFQPFIIRKLKERGLADTIKSAKRMLERREIEVWDVLEEAIKNHPVLLNRAPTLHRMGIQAFEPVLVEGNAIKIHPLVCTGYNADFDGDQMAVHLPLSVEAQTEAHVLMMSTHNIFSPANGNPIVSPSQDIVMGVYFLTVTQAEPPVPLDRCLKDGPATTPEERKRLAREVPHFAHPHEAILAWETGAVDYHQWIAVRLDRFSETVLEAGKAPKSLRSGRTLTTVGRLLFNEILPHGMPFYNCTLGKKGAAKVIDDTFRRQGKAATIRLLDDMKETGFRYSTRSGLSFGVTDMRIPDDKQRLLDDAEKRVAKSQRQYESGAITDQERRNQVLEAWAKCRNDVSEKLMETLKNDWRDAENVPADPSKAGVRRYLNPVFLFADSGARGNKSQMQQLAGMRGLMAKPSGEIIETPIKANFREGLSVLEYFSSTHGARKGLADTALKTADSGYLTRKLCDVAQSVTVAEEDCGTRRGVPKKAVMKGEDVEVPLRDVIYGRTALATLIDPRTDRTIVAAGQLIDAGIGREIEEFLGADNAFQVRSPLTCESERGICAKCYGMDLATGKAVEQGMAVGIIAAQSIGEPGTQLTMRTFHTGGIAYTTAAESQYKALNAGVVELVDCNEVDVDGRFVVLKKTGLLRIRDAKGRELETFKVPYGSFVQAAPGVTVKKGELLLEWDPHKTPILSEKSGTVHFEDIVEGETVKVETKAGGVRETIVIEHKGERHPRVEVRGEDGRILDFHHLPAKARIEVQDGASVKAGQMLAHTPKESARSADIVGGLPRVTEVFEARKPKEPAVLAEIGGVVELLSDKRKGKMTIRVVDGEVAVEHHVPQGTHLLVHAGDPVAAGDPLVEGPRDPADIVRIKGEEALYVYMLDEVQNVYRAQGVPISDKHIEVILKQMLSKVRVVQSGDTSLLPNEVVDKSVLRRVNGELDDMLFIEEPGQTTLPKGTLQPRDEVKEANATAENQGKDKAKTRKPKKAVGRTLLLGITKASLQSESFLSGASFQETTKVLTEAALKSAVDTLVGLKENVLLGHLIPAGTGFKPYQAIRVKRLVEEPIDDETSEMEMEDAELEAEALGAERPGTGATVGDRAAALADGTVSLGESLLAVEEAEGEEPKA
jgi:DNA-directed RNA polymerase subunit beta'